MNSHRNLISAPGVMLLISVCGCLQHEWAFNLVDSHTAGRIPMGTSVRDVRATLGTEGAFAFHIQNERGKLLGIEYYVGSTRSPMYFVFENGSLHSIVPYRYAQKAVMEGTRYTILIPTDPNERLKETLDGECYFGDKLVQYAEQREWKPKRRIPNNLIPLLIAGTINPALAVYGLGEELGRPHRPEVRAKARKTWSYERIEFGMKRDEVEKIFGDARFKQKEGALRGCVYGDRTKGVEIAVEYENDQVKAMFGYRFHPFDWTGERRKFIAEQGWKPREK